MQQPIKSKPKHAAINLEGRDVEETTLQRVHHGQPEGLAAQGGVSGFEVPLDGSLLELEGVESLDGGVDVGLGCAGGLEGADAVALRLHGGLLGGEGLAERILGGHGGFGGDEAPTKPRPRRRRRR